MAWVSFVTLVLVILQIEISTRYKRLEAVSLYNKYTDFASKSNLGSTQVFSESGLIGSKRLAKYINEVSVSSGPIFDNNERISKIFITRAMNNWSRFPIWVFRVKRDRHKVDQSVIAGQLIIEINAACRYIDHRYMRRIPQSDKKRLDQYYQDVDEDLLLEFRKILQRVQESGVWEFSPKRLKNIDQIKQHFGKYNLWDDHTPSQLADHVFWMYPKFRDFLYGEGSGEVIQHENYRKQNHDS